MGNSLSAPDSLRNEIQAAEAVFKSLDEQLKSRNIGKEQNDKLTKDWEAARLNMEALKSKLTSLRHKHAAFYDVQLDISITSAIMKAQMDQEVASSSPGPANVEGLATPTPPPENPSAPAQEGETQEAAATAPGSPASAAAANGVPDCVPTVFNLKVHSYPETSWNKVVSVQGNFNRGKTWFLANLCGAPLPEEGNATHTTGLGLKYASPDQLQEGGAGFLVVDSEGMQSPIRMMFNLAPSGTTTLKRPPYFSYQKVEEEFRRDLLLELSDHVIVVINDLASADQEFLWSIAEKRFNAGEPGQIILVHNLRCVKTKADLTKIQKDVEAIFQGTKVERDRTGADSVVTLVTPIPGRSSIRHVFLMQEDWGPKKDSSHREDSNQECVENNKKVFNLVRRWITNDSHSKWGHNSGNVMPVLPTASTSAEMAKKLLDSWAEKVVPLRQALQKILPRYLSNIDQRCIEFVFPDSVQESVEREVRRTHQTFADEGARAAAPEAAGPAGNDGRAFHVGGLVQKVVASVGASISQSKLATKLVMKTKPEFLHDLNNEVWGEFRLRPAQPTQKIGLLLNKSSDERGLFGGGAYDADYSPSALVKIERGTETKAGDKVIFVDLVACDQNLSVTQSVSGDTVTITSKQSVELVHEGDTVLLNELRRSDVKRTFDVGPGYTLSSLSKSASGLLEVRLEKIQQRVLKL